MAGQIAELAHRTLRARLPPHRPDAGADHPARRRAARCCRRSATSSSTKRAAPAAQDRRRGRARREGRRRRRDRHRGRGRATAHRAHRVGDQDLGGRRAAPARSAAARRADRRGGGPGRPGRGQPGPARCPGHPEIFVVGDMMALNNLPGRRPGRHPGRPSTPPGRSSAGSPGKPPRQPFKYFDKGSMATISRFRAVGERRQAAAPGFIAWLMWLVVHLHVSRRLQEPGHHGAALGRQLHRPRPLAAGRHVQQVFARRALQEYRQHLP